MYDHITHTPAVSKQQQSIKFTLKLSCLLVFSLLLWLGSPVLSSATILTKIHFEWSYDTTQSGLMGYMVYQENQPIININDPSILSTDLDVYLETGQQNSFTITAYDNLGNESTPSPPYIVDVPPEEISGNIPPVGIIEISSLSGPAPLTVDVSASKSIDYDGLIISYGWNFGDGGFSSYENDFHTFETPGTYIIILEVTDDDGSLSTAETTVIVTDPEIEPNQPPTPLIYTTTNSGPAPLDVLFDGTDSTDSDGTIIDYSWDFGDGSSGNGIFVNYIYAAIGTFTGQLTVTDDAGASASDQTVISVAASDPLNNPPLAVINASPLTGAAPLSTIFSGADSTDSDGVIISYDWDFGDGSIVSGADVSHQYITSGTYTATLTVTDEMGDTGQAQIIISVSEEILTSTVIYTDDFSTDTSSSYTNINGVLSVLNGTAHGANWQITFAHHNLSLGTSDHWVEAEVTYDGISSSAGLISRVDTANKTGYTAYFSAGKIILNHFVGTSQSWLASQDGAYAAGTYMVRMVATGSIIQVYVDGSLKIQKTDTTYAYGPYAGCRFNRGMGNVDVTADNLKAGIGSPPPFAQQNTPPVVQNTSFTAQEDTTVIGTFIVSDLDGDPLTTSIVSNGTLGNVTITNPLTGAYSYTPNTDASGMDTFTFKANDGTADSNIGTITVTIVSVNDPPVAADDTVATNEDVPASGRLLASDIEGDQLTYAIVTNGILGTAVVSDPSTGAFSYTPKADTSGTDTFTFKANDGTDDSNVATITVTINKVSVSGLNDDFSTDTSSTYTAISGSMTIADGKAHGQQWTDTRAFHNSAFDSDDQFVEADVYYSGSVQGAGLLIRVEPTKGTGYLAYFESDRLHLASIAGTTKKWLGQYNGSYPEGTYRLRIEAEGSTIRIYVNSGLVLVKEDSTYTVGKHVGLRFNQGSSTADMHLDNLSAGMLNAPPQEEEPIMPAGIADDFSTDTSSKYTAISGSMTIADGKAHGQQWTDTRVFHNTAFDSDDQFVEANVYYSGSVQGAGLLIRVESTLGTGYLAYFESGRIHLASIAGTTKKWLGQYNGSYAEGTYHLRMEAEGSIISLFVNGVLVLQKEDASYPTGKHTGLRFNQGSSDSDMHLDNLSAGIL